MSDRPDATQTAAEEIEKRKAGGEGSPPSPDRPKRGRPKGSKTKKRGVSAPPPEEPITPEEIAMYAFLGGTIWDISARFFNLDKLTEEERAKLGEAMAPVARKYLPMLDDYAPEANLVIMVAGLVIAKQRKEPGEDLELIGGSKPDTEEPSP